MALIEIKDLTFRYATGSRNALCGVSAKIDAGEFVAVIGSSGSGKSTLVKMLKPSLTPHGAAAGEIIFDNAPISSLSKSDESRKIGFVSQSPENQIVTDKVWHELAFALESLGMGQSEMHLRVAEMASFFDIEDKFHKNTADLSGGEKQLLNLASVMTTSPSVLLLDEPTSRLDPIAAGKFLDMLKKINQTLGVTVIMCAHDLDHAFSVCDRVIVLDEGRVIADASPAMAGEMLIEQNHPMALALPAAMRLYAALGGDMPNSEKDAREYLSQRALGRELRPLKDAPENENGAAVSVKDLYFRYEKAAPDVLSGVNLEIKEGEIFALLGGNGAGKSTLLSLLSQLRRPTRGSINLFGKKAAYLVQDVQTVFLKSTVKADLSDISKDEDKLSRVIELCGLKDLLDRHPYDLSGGEQKRAALAKILLLDPEILLLDEPTSGLDAEFKLRFGAILAALKSRGKTVIIATHDCAFCAEVCDRAALLFDGDIALTSPVRGFFSQKSFYTTAANRISRHIIPDAVTVDDIIYAFGETPKKNDFTPREPHFEESAPLPLPENKKSAITPRTFLAALIVFLAVPFTVWAGVRYFGDRKYYFISLLVILETTLPFIFAFEGRKPRARETVLISVMCAVAVAGRGAFYMLPQFKPVIAVVIIAGAVFGAEAGFLVGSVSGFVSNFFVGQGPWTPWQMFGFGIIGFLAGMLFKNIRSRAVLCCFGAFSAVVIYGVIMDMQALLAVQPDPNLNEVLAYLTAGLPFNLIHGAATVFFLWIGAKPMFEKLDRARLKYGLV